VTEAAGVPWRSGAWGVDLFFVLSGFLMIAITDGGARPWAFFKDRLLRVAPLYWIATSAMVVAALVGIAPNVAIDPVRVFTSFAFIPYGPQTMRNIASPILAVGWTLNVEMLFYTLFTLILFLPRYRLAVLTCILCGLVLLGRIVGPTGPILALWTLPILLEFVVGGWVAMMWLRPALRRPRIALAAVVIFALLARPAMVLVTAMLVGTLILEARGRVPTWRPFLLLGDASYSIYLWQIFPLQCCFVLARLLHLPMAPMAVVAFIGAIGGGIIAYLLIERPLLKFFHRRRARRGITIPSGP
jgi:exopolysaccharide production protein ExoZ